MDLRAALVIDFVILLASGWCILQISDRSIFNPALWYLALHGYTVSFRLATLNLGGQSLPVIGIRSDIEFVNAAIASDISLLAVVAATFLVAQSASRGPDGGCAEASRYRLSPRLGQILSIFCLAVGTFALIKFRSAAWISGGDRTNIDICRFEESSYPIWVSGFAVQGSLIQCALRGFTRGRVLILLFVLLLSAFNARTAFVLASAMAFLIYQTRRNQSSIPLKGVIGVFLLGLVWFVYKPVLGAIAGGGNPEEILATAEDYIANSVGDTPTSIDTQFLDMQATYMAAADEADRRFYGATVLPLLYLPIPRFLWPDKPPLNVYGPELSTSSRMMAQVGMTPLLSGESYMNFGWPGCALIPFVYMMGMQVGYQRVRWRGISDAGRWVYMIYLVSMVQIYRDGLDSIVLFPFMVYLPMLSWGVISMLLPKQKLMVDPSRSIHRPSVDVQRVG